MFWDNGKAKAAFTAMLLAGGVITLSTPAVAQSVVVRSTGPSAGQYPPGKKLAANARVTLKQGDVVTVLDKGGTRVLRGPQTVSLSTRVANASTNRGVSSFMRTRSGARARTGAVRSTGTAAPGQQSEMRSPNLWYVDISRPGTYCVADPKTTVLWRTDVQTNMTATLSDAAGSAMSPLEWQRGNALERWPIGTVPLQDGASYRISMGDAEPMMVTIRMMDAVSEDLDSTASALIERGCQQQLDLLVDKLASDDAAATSASM